MSVAAAAAAAVDAAIKNSRNWVGGSRKYRTPCLKDPRGSRIRGFWAFVCIA